MNLQDNLTKAEQLLPNLQYGVKLFLNDCYNQKLYFTVTSVFRSQADQERIYAQGRTTPGKIVSWTTHSQHTLRIAMDVAAENCTYEQIEKVANIYGIHRDPALIKLFDLGHFVCSGAIQEPQEPKYTPQAIARRLGRIIATSVNPLRARLQIRLSSFLNS